MDTPTEGAGLSMAAAGTPVAQKGCLGLTAGGAGRPSIPFTGHRFSAPNSCQSTQGLPITSPRAM